MEYVIWCDESDKKGRYYSNFYGGALVRSIDIPYVKRTLAEAKQKLNLFNEVKWSKVSANYCKKYIELIDVFFDLIQQDKVKIRIMFTKNSRVPTGLTKAQRDQEFFILYYQFVKHAFGLTYSNDTKENINIKIFFDKLPDKKEKVTEFKRYIYGVQNLQEFQKANIKIKYSDIGEVDSKKEDVLQCFDIILGSMSFRLNNKHLEKPEGSRFRAKKTIAKERLYKHINSRIRMIKPGFNIGISTGTNNGITDRWNMPYRHWLFTSRQTEYDSTKDKP